MTEKCTCQHEELISILKDDLKEIKRDVKDGFKTIDKDMKGVIRKTAMLEAKSGILGILGGSVVILVKQLIK